MSPVQAASGRCTPARPKDALRISFGVIRPGLDHPPPRPTAPPPASCRAPPEHIRHPPDPTMDHREGVLVMTRRRITVLISVAAVAAAGLGAGLAIAASGSGTQAPVASWQPTSRRSAARASAWIRRCPWRSGSRYSREPSPTPGRRHARPVPLRPETADCGNSSALPCNGRRRNSRTSRQAWPPPANLDSRRRA